MDILTKELSRILGDIIKPIVEQTVCEALAKHDDDQEFGPRVSVRVVSRLSGLSTTTIYQYHSANLIPGAVKVGGRLLFETDKILRWIDEGCPREIQ